MRATPEPEYLACHLLYRIVCSIVNDPDRVSIHAILTGDDMTFSISVDRDDSTAFRGEEDRNLEAIKTLFGAIAFREKRFSVIAGPEVDDTQTLQERLAAEEVA